LGLGLCVGSRPLIAFADSCHELATAFDAIWAEAQRFLEI
jgi:hypothetical protein